MDELIDLAEKVNDRESFLDFVDALAADFAAEEKIESIRPSDPYGPGALGWENGSIDTFLDACTACVRANLEHEEPTVLLGEDPNWTDLALFLLRGKYYE